jgi:hypothetical protein
MYSGKIAVPPGGGGIRKIVTNQYDLFDNKLKIKCTIRDQLTDMWQ